MSDIESDEDAYYALRRVAGKIVVSKRFPFMGSSPGDPLIGRACRFAYTVYDTETESEFASENGWELVIRETPTRQQVKVIFFENGRGVPQIAFQRFKDGTTIHRESFSLRGQETQHLMQFLQLLQSNDLQFTDGERIQFAPELTAQVLEDRDAVNSYVRQHPDVLKSIIQSDVSAPDVIALARRKNTLELFDALLNDEEFFASTSNEHDGPEKTWQWFFEANPWIISGTLAPQFLHSYNPNRLEQTIRGYSVASSGRRVDALLRTAGIVSSIVLIEIKHHQTELLSPSQYRSDIWNVGKDVIGGVAQCHSAVDLVERELGPLLEITDEERSTIDHAAVCRPRSLLVVGSLGQFRVDGNLHRTKYESFERFRRSLRDPEIVTFDELYERARYLLNLAEDRESLTQT
jgi:hypothetical protein